MVVPVAASEPAAPAASRSRTAMVHSSTTRDTADTVGTAAPVDRPGTEGMADTAVQPPQRRTPAAPARTTGSLMRASSAADRALRSVAQDRQRRYCRATRCRERARRIPRGAGRCFGERCRTSRSFSWCASIGRCVQFRKVIDTHRRFRCRVNLRTRPILRTLRFLPSRLIRPIRRIQLYRVSPVRRQIRAMVRRRTASQSAIRPARLDRARVLEYRSPQTAITDRNHLPAMARTEGTMMGSVPFQERQVVKVEAVNIRKSRSCPAACRCAVPTTC